MTHLRMLGVGLVLAATVLGQGSKSAEGKKPLRVLFVGNSYTYFNALPDVFAAMAASHKKTRPVHTVDLSKPGYTLERHWKEGLAQDAMKKTRYHFVVLQEQSMRPVVDKKAMYVAARRFDAVIRRSGARTAFLMTWARKKRPAMIKGLGTAYDEIGRELKAIVIPAGRAWARALKEKPKFALHVKDGSHPSPSGTYLAAACAYRVLLEREPKGLPGKLTAVRGPLKGRTLVNLARRDAAWLQSVARKTATRSRESTKKPAKKAP